MPGAKAAPSAKIQTRNRSAAAGRRAAATNPVRPGVVPGTFAKDKKPPAALTDAAMASTAPINTPAPAAQSHVRMDGHDNLCQVRGTTRYCWCMCVRCFDKTVAHCVCKHCNCPQATGAANAAMRDLARRAG